MGGEVESLQKEIISGKQSYTSKIEEFEDKIQIMLNKFNKEKKELNEKLKILQNKVKFADIDKGDEIRKYENLVSNLSERLYKMEGKKYCYTKQHTKDMKAYDRAKSLGKSDTIQINKQVSKTLYKKNTSVNNLNNDEFDDSNKYMEEIQKTYNDTKEDRETEKQLKRYHSAKKERYGGSENRYHDSNKKSTDRDKNKEKVSIIDFSFQ